MSYSRLSNNLANYICKEINVDGERQEIITYAIENLLLGAGGFIFIIIIGFLFHAVIPAVAAAIVGALLRRFSGGAHLSTPMKCLVVGAFAYGTLGVVSKYLAYQLPEMLPIAGLIVSLALVSLYAPVDCPAKPIKSNLLRKKLKLGSICFVVVVLLFVLTVNISHEVKFALTLGVLYQSITLIPILNKGGDIDA